MDLKKIFAVSGVFMLLAAGIARAEEAKTTETLGGVDIGGHIKMHMYDGTEGERNGVKQQNNSSAGAAGHAFYLYVSKELASWLKLESQVEVQYSASATPKLGSDITRAAATTRDVELPQLYMNVMMPCSMEMKVGSFSPMYSEYYSRETWWNEQYNLNPGVGYLIAMHDTGIEVYKNFDLEAVSLPVYVGVLNGATYSDTNNDKLALLHVAPELLGGKLKLEGSYASGKYDTADLLYKTMTLGGFEATIVNVKLRGEYSTVVQQDKIAAGQNSVNWGYFVQGMYLFNDMWRAGLNVSHADNKSAAAYSEIWDTNTILIDCFVTPNSSIIGQYTIADGKRSDDSEKLKYNRFTLAWRTTF